MNRLYVVESTPTTTGAKADHRLPLKARQVESLASLMLTVPMDSDRAYKEIGSAFSETEKKFAVQAYLDWKGIVVQASL